MSARRLLAAFALAVLVGAAGIASCPATAGDDDASARLLAAPESAPDPERLRRAAEEALEKDPKDERAMRALLLAVGRLRDPDLLDDAIERAGAWTAVPEDRAEVRRALGGALLRRARLDDPPDAERLRRAAGLLAAAADDGPLAEALDLAHALHLLADLPGARAAYAEVLRRAGPSLEEDAIADRAVEGLRNVGAGEDPRLVEGVPPGAPAVRRALSAMEERAGRLEGAVAALTLSPAGPPPPPRSLVVRARLLRALGRHAAALADERAAVKASGTLAKGGGFVLDAVETLWRSKRPLESFADCDALARDYDDLVARAEGFPDHQMAWLNNVAFRLREVVSVYTWRGEGRSQGIAPGAPKEVHALLARCVALYDGAVSKVPKDDPGASFETRWTRAGVLNDAGLMRHYFVDVRDLARAEALYLRAFDLTDGAYMDTYFYNLQYLYGFELEGRDEAWLRLAQRARSAILAEAPGGGFVPDERKRDAAARDAEALRRRVEEKAGR